MSYKPLQSIVEALRADSAAIMVPNRRHLFCYASYNMPQEWIDIRNSFDEKVPGGNVEVYRTGKPAITNHLRKMLEGYFIESVMIVPIQREGKTIAILELIHDRDNKTFDETDQQAAEKYAKDIEPSFAI